MLQVPCLSPPIYGHSHYKKFWLRQTELGGVSCEMKSTSTPDASSSKRICGKRRPQLRSSLASSKTDVERLQVPLNESPPAVSSTSSGEFPSGWKRSFRKFQRGSDGDAANSPLSSLENRDGVETPIRSGSPADDKSFISMSEDKSSLQFLQLNECQASLLATQEEKEECKQLVRQNRSSTDSDDEPNVSHSSEQTAAASLDCLTSKCKGIDSRQEDDGSEQDSDNENSSSESDSAISSTSQASDHDDARSHSDRSSFREHLKRNSKREAIKAIDAKPASYGSPKTRQMAAALENPVSPSGRSTQVMGSSSVNNGHNVSRTCKHCGTMKTPLWRNGPLGPKSLCNACGIRLRKARRSSNHEGQTTNLTGKRKLVQAEATLISDLSRHPYKKSRLTFAREKREHAEIDGIRGSRSLAFGYDLKPSMLGKSLSKDEEEGAVLLMALSCGLVLA